VVFPRCRYLAQCYSTGVDNLEGFQQKKREVSRAQSPVVHYKSLGVERWGQGKVTQGLNM